MPGHQQVAMTDERKSDIIVGRQNMRKFLLTTTLIAGLGAPVTSAHAQDMTPYADMPAGVYNIDQTHAQIIWQVSHLGLSDYTARFSEFDAQLTFDPKNPENSFSGSSDVTIAWDDAASNELKLEKIITQKWISLFPNGQEAWSEFRRTGYPRLIPVVVNYSGGLIDTEEFVRRTPFPSEEYNIHNEGVQTGVELLGGPDNGGTRVWWDTGASNF